MDELRLPKDAALRLPRCAFCGKKMLHRYLPRDEYQPYLRACLECAGVSPFNRLYGLRPLWQCMLLYPLYRLSPRLCAFWFDPLGKIR